MAHFNRSSLISSLALFAGLATAQACGSTGECTDTGTCGEFVAPSDCAWLAGDGGLLASSTDELEAMGATWSESEGWRLPNGAVPGYQCDLLITDGGGVIHQGGSSGSGGSAQGNSGTGGDGGAGGASGGQGNGGNGGDGGGSGSGGEGGNGPVLCGSPFESGCTPDSTGGIFVDASAGDDGDGSKGNPVNSVNQALQLAVDQQATDIYICAGDYDESVLITDEDVGIDLHGGFDCDGFTYDPQALPTISPQAGGYALHIDALMSPLLVEDIEFIAVDGVNPGDSSVAVFVAASSDVTFNRVIMTAGLGANGDDGTMTPFVEGPTSGVNWPTLASLSVVDDADSGTGIDGALADPPFTCPAGDASYGGNGGNGNFSSATDGGSGGPLGRGGTGGTVASCDDTNTGGGNGTPGPDGADGDGGSTGGAINASGFVPNAGGDGAPGEVGGGGGGGGGATGSGTSGGGGGGGAGGCGGNLGAGGQGGGASVALLIYDSIVTVNASALTSAAAGDGGDGKAGQQGQHIDGSPTQASFGGGGYRNACDGGNGAAGGNGGSGGGGAGGLSAGIVHDGGNPLSVDANTDITIGAAGLGGNGGGATNDGAAGDAQDIIAL